MEEEVEEEEEEEAATVAKETVAAQNEDDEKKLSSKEEEEEEETISDKVLDRVLEIAHDNNSKANNEALVISHRRDDASLSILTSISASDLSMKISVDLSYNALRSGTLPAILSLLSKCQKLETLNLNGNYFGDADLMKLCNSDIASRLTTLTIDNNLITHPPVNFLKLARNLTHFSANHNPYAAWHEGSLDEIKMSMINECSSAMFVGFENREQETLGTLLHQQTLVRMQISDFAISMGDPLKLWVRHPEKSKQQMWIYVNIPEENSRDQHHLEKVMVRITSILSESPQPSVEPCIFVLYTTTAATFSKGFLDYDDWYAAIKAQCAARSLRANVRKEIKKIAMLNPNAYIKTLHDEFMQSLTTKDIDNTVYDPLLMIHELRGLIAGLEKRLEDKDRVIANLNSELLAHKQKVHKLQNSEEDLFKSHEDLQRQLRDVLARYNADIARKDRDTAETVKELETKNRQLQFEALHRYAPTTNTNMLTELSRKVQFLQERLAISEERCIKAWEHAKDDSLYVAMSTRMASLEQTNRIMSKEVQDLSSEVLQLETSRLDGQRQLEEVESRLLHTEQAFRELVAHISSTSDVTTLPEKLQDTLKFEGTVIKSLSNAGEVKVTVKTITGKLVETMAIPTETVKSFKDRVRKVLDFDAKAVFKLIHKGDVLKEEHILGYYGIENGTQLTMLR